MSAGGEIAGRRYVVHGRVQGVSFRWYTQRVAMDSGVSGWVRNCRDGTVEAEGWGSPAQLAEFEERLRAGSPLSRVDRLDREDLRSEDLTPAPGTAGADFEIRTTI